jgi:hypothetical protein
MSLDSRAHLFIERLRRGKEDKPADSRPVCGELQRVRFLAAPAAGGDQDCCIHNDDSKLSPR